jgi:hypothetical protein
MTQRKLSRILAMLLSRSFWSTVSYPYCSGQEFHPNKETMRGQAYLLVISVLGCVVAWMCSATDNAKHALQVFFRILKAL